MNREFVRFAKARSLDKMGILKLINGVPILVLKVDDKYFAYVAICDHKNHLLCNRELVDNKILCPGHRELFDRYTGEPLMGLAKRDLIILETVVKDGIVFVEKPDRRLLDDFI
jgi:nitrite reductase/ring-hydroxylating ferredoxin subunit